MSNKPMRVENIVKKFGPFTALNGVDLEVHAGEVPRSWGITVRGNQP